MRMYASVIATAGLVVSLVAVGPAQSASASTAVTLYVDGAQGTQSAGCASPGTGACSSLQEGINAAEALTNSAVTLQVVPGAFQGEYVEDDLIQGLPSTDSLTIQGVGGPIINGAGSGTTITIRANTGNPKIVLDGLTLTGGRALGNAGGAVAVYPGAAVTISNDTITQNSGRGSGGAVYNASGGTVTVTNSTITNNTAQSPGSAIFTLLGTTILSFDTFYNNNVAGEPAINNSDPYETTNLSNSILVNTPCNGGNGGNPTDQGGNVESDNSCSLGENSTVNSTSINLATALAANGSTGPMTLAIGSNSSAYHRVSASACAATTRDERGFPRPGIGTLCDAGAFELQPPPAVPTVGSTTSSGVTATTATLQASVKPNGADTTVTATCSGGPSTSPSVDIGSGFAATTPSLQLTGLTPSTPYSCAVTATNSLGTATSASAAGFTTPSAPPPTVGATTMTTTATATAALFAPVNPNGFDTTVTATCTGGPYSASSTDAGTATAAASTEVDLSGLSRSTTYSCAVTATNLGGTTTSPNPLTFTTAATTPPDPPSGSTSSANATSIDPQGTATATDQGVGATGDGVGSLTVALYPNGSSAIPAFTASQSSFDVAVDPASTFTSVTITDTDVGAGDVIYWFDGSQYRPVDPQSFDPGPPATITMTLSDTSTPALSELNGTIFAVARPSQVSTLYLNPTRVHAIHGHRQRLTLAHLRDAANPPARTFQVMVAWGDGTHTKGKVEKSSRDRYVVIGTHRYHSRGAYRTTITVTHRGHRARAHGRIRVS